ncbi:hypothetical protein MNV49_001067 [Pseudohyphozyma bogoriensis]|nr:hypothetical protein MNV49_001067 [Pseudohyphozyma bogoriensis]
MGTGLNCHENRSTTQLHDYAIDGEADKLAALLETAEERSKIDAVDGYGYTPLHLAADRGHLKVVEVLVKAGADTSIKEEEGMTALELAEEAGHVEIATLLRGAAK